MAVQFIKIPTSSKKLGDEAIRLIDWFQTSQLSEDDLVDAVATWKENVPQLLLADDSSDGSLVSPTLIKYIGKRRALVLATLLTNKVR